MTQGNPRCSKCNGRGAIMLRGRFVVCTCRKMTTVRRALQREQSNKDLDAFRRVQERIRQRQEGK